MEIRRGIAVSEGIAIGPALVLDTEGVRIPFRTVPADRVDGEIARLRAALLDAADSARVRQQSLADKLGDDMGDIIGSHVGLFEDPKRQAEFESLIRVHNYSAEYAVSRGIRGYLKRLEANDAAWAARLRPDFLDLEKQLLGALVGDRTQPLAQPGTPVVVVANDLTPTETSQLDPKTVHALATESGGATSHTAILAGALEIPAVVGVGKFLNDVSGGDTVIVDGTQGLVILDPDDATLRRYELLRRAQLSASGIHRLPTREVPAVTRDGSRIHLHGNIEFPSEARPCLDRGADGIGLYRTEFLYTNKSHDPTEEEQYEAYCAVLTEFGSRPVVIRTLDLGGDKFVPATGIAAAEKNPFLGLRSVRLCLRNLPLFKTQLRAILRASVHGDARVMFPMISTVMELRHCKSVWREVQEDLEEAGIPYKHDLPVGTMIEVPSAALMADVLAKQVDFFSIGTNDLVQYTLAADRNNETVADLYNPADPAVLRLIAQVVKAAAACNVPVTVCGEMSGEPAYTALLVGLGIRSLSATPRKIPELKRTVLALAVPDAEKLAAEALRMETAREVNALLSAHWRRTLPDQEV